MEIHTLLILLGVLPFLFLKISKKESLAFLSKKGATIIAVVSVLMFIVDLITHLMI